MQDAWMIPKCVMIDVMHDLMLEWYGYDWCMMKIVKICQNGWAKIHSLMLTWCKHGWCKINAKMTAARCKDNIHKMHAYDYVYEMTQTLKEWCKHGYARAMQR